MVGADCAAAVAAKGRSAMAATAARRIAWGASARGDVWAGDVWKGDGWETAR
jgi:hypothetical protein